MLNNLLTTHNLQSLLITKPENVRYVSGFAGSFGWVLLQRDQVPMLITDSRYAEAGQTLCAKKDLKLALVDKLENDVADCVQGDMGVEDTMSLGQFNRLKKRFPNAELKSQHGLIEDLRRTKSEDEIENITIAQNHVNRVLFPFLKSVLKEGVTESEVTFQLELALRDRGKFELSFPSIVAFGENGSLPHHHPGERKLKKGDPVLIDCGVQYEGYCSDITRNVAFGDVGSEYLNAYETLLNAQEKTLEKCVAGADVAELDLFCRKELGDLAPFFTHSLGHGVGLEIHEAPSITSKKKSDAKKPTLLRENEVITCEPGVYCPGKFGIRIEDLLVVQKNKIQVLSDIPKILMKI